AADGSHITIVFPSGTGLSNSVSWSITDDTSGQQLVAGSNCASCSGSEFQAGVGGAIGPGDHVTVVLNGVVNPPGPGVYTVQVSTSSEPIPAASTSYLILPALTASFVARG